MKKSKYYGPTHNFVHKQRKDFRAQPKSKGRKIRDAHNQGLVLSLGEIAKCSYPACEWSGVRRELGAHWKGKHTR